MAECPLCNDDRILISSSGDAATARICDCQNPCPRCGGTAYFYETDEFGYRIATPCYCVQLNRRAKLFSEANLPARYVDAEFTRIQTDARSDMANARRKALRFSREYEPGSKGLLFHGSVGTGKTFISVAIVRYLIVNRGVKARFIEFMHLLSDLRSTFGDRRQADEVMQPLVDVPVLVIDELGKGRGSDWELSVLDELISKRYNAQRTTLFTTNYGIELPAPGASLDTETLVDRVGMRIYSRLMEMCEPVRISGVDRRRPQEQRS